MTEQRESYKAFIEDLARIWLEYLIVYSEDGVQMEEEIPDASGENYIQLVTVPQSVLQKLQASVKIDVTPKGVYDKFAQEQSLENFLTAGFFNIQRLGELKAYVKALDDDSVTPKMKLMEVIEAMEAEQQKIAMIEAQAQMMQQRAQQFLMEDPDGQADQMADAQAQIEAEYAAEEQGLDEQTAEAEEDIEE